MEFEKRNDWTRTTDRPQACFEVSSDGELEQVWPLMEQSLVSGECIELIYCSPSLEKNLCFPLCDSSSIRF